jgi:hypothetical protein
MSLLRGKLYFPIYTNIDRKMGGKGDIPALGKDGRIILKWIFEK